MPNKRYSDLPTDAAVKETKSKKGMKNEDGRLGGEKYNAQNKAKFSTKETQNPNEDAQRLEGGTILSGPNREGAEEGAY